eukprot:g3150.t1
MAGERKKKAGMFGGYGACDFVAPITSAEWTALLDKLGMESPGYHETLAYMREKRRLYDIEMAAAFEANLLAKGGRQSPSEEL